MVCTNRGHLLHEEAERDVYVRAVQTLAERLTLPDRTLPLMVCTNRGHLLHEEAERDVYVRAVQTLAERL
ncbi:hypothetical protein CTI14_71140, partial [Methylobacterium radiotolerans]